MQQNVQIDATCNIQQCWKLLANNVVFVCTGLYTLSEKKKIDCLQSAFSLKICLVLVSASAIASFIAARMLSFRVQ